jgi:hypothetical protein
VDPEETMAREGEVAEKLAALGLEHGAGAAVWRRVILDELAHHVETRELFMAENATNDTFAQYHGTALVIVVAVDQILRFEHRVRQLTGDAALQKARKAFDDEVGGSANNIRDVAMHLDDYAIGIGNRQTGKQGPAVTERYVRNTVYWTDLNESYISLGGHQLSVEGTAHAAVELAEVVERVRGSHQRLRSRGRASAVSRPSFRPPLRGPFVTRSSAARRPRSRNQPGAAEPAVG